MPYLTLDSTYDYLESIDPDFYVRRYAQVKNIRLTDSRNALIWVSKSVMNFSIFHFC
jgi:hypothetical protein